MAINVRQLKPLVVTGEDGTVTVAPDSAIAAGSTLVVIGVARWNLHTFQRTTQGFWMIGARDELH